MHKAAHSEERTHPIDTTPSTKCVIYRKQYEVEKLNQGVLLTIRGSVRMLRSDG